eukprot:1425809-Pyramimonas_sp.AAC.1
MDAVPGGVVADLCKIYGDKWRSEARAHSWSHIHNRKTLCDTTIVKSLGRVAVGVVAVACGGGGDGDDDDSDEGDDDVGGGSHDADESF